MNQNQDDLHWSEEYLIYMEQNFDKLFKEIYEQEFVDLIFEESEAIITKDDFRTAIAGDLDDEAKLDWLFSPSKIRKVI